MAKIKMAKPPAYAPLQQKCWRLTHILNKVWVSMMLPDDWGWGIILPLWKHKGDQLTCSNHRGITLLSIPGKLFIRILLTRTAGNQKQVPPTTSRIYAQPLHHWLHLRSSAYNDWHGLWHCGPRDPLEHLQVPRSPSQNNCKGGHCTSTHVKNKNVVLHFTE